MIACLAARLGPRGRGARRRRRRGSYLYRTTLLQAAPGKLLEVVELYKAGWPGTTDERRRAADRDAAQPGRPLGPAAALSDGQLERVLRARPGRPAREGPRGGERRSLAKLADDVAWQEDVFVFGPPLEEVRGQLGRGRLLPRRDVRGPAGQARPSLYRQREMENAYSKAPRIAAEPRSSCATRRRRGTSSRSAAYRDLKHYAESADVPAAKQEEAARAAGFDGVEGDRSVPADASSRSTTTRWRWRSSRERAPSRLALSRPWGAGSLEAGQPTSSLSPAGRGIGAEGRPGPSPSSSRSVRTAVCSSAAWRFSGSSSPWIARNAGPTWPGLNRPGYVRR